MFYEGLHKTFLGTTKKCGNKNFTIFRNARDFNYLIINICLISKKAEAKASVDRMVFSGKYQKIFRRQKINSFNQAEKVIFFFGWTICLLG